MTSHTEEKKAIESGAGGEQSVEKAPKSRPRKGLLTVVLLLAAVAAIVVAMKVFWGGAGATQVETPAAPATVEKAASAGEAHPLDPALELAHEGLSHIQENVADYTATILKRERVGGTLRDQERIFAKVRNRKLVDGEVVKPFSVYLKFEEPKSAAGREVIWVEGQNDGKLIAHEGGFAGFIRASLPPTGFLAMRGNRYPIMDIGIENLVAKLIVKGNENRQHGECEVIFDEEAMLDGEQCTQIIIRHPVKRPYFDFYEAHIFFDRERTVPLRYAAYTWPETPGGEPVLEEEYTYLDLKLNVGLTDEDFDPDNPEYEYP